MFSFVDKSKGLLFSSGDLREMLEQKVRSLEGEVEGMNGERLLNTSPGDLVNYLVEKFTLTKLALRRDEWTVDEQEAQIDVSRDPNRVFSVERSEPFYIPGQRIEVNVPFDGDPAFFFMRASQFTSNPPRAEIRGNTLVLVFQQSHDQQRDIRPEIDRLLVEIDQHIGWSNAQIAQVNSTLHQRAEQTVNGRRQRLLANQSRVASLGIPVRERAGAPKTYAIPDVRRKAVPTMPPASTALYTPEPTWEIAHYEHALDIIKNMALVMERSPSAFASMDEEALRQHFLVQLNGQFEGRATGETFNYGGKTDILLRENGRNVFIAECKFWKGPKKFSDAVDQLLGYTSWRDSKTAILVFNRGTDMTTVLGGIESVMTSHLNFKRAVAWNYEAGHRYVLHQPGDKNRELIVSVMVFHIPAPDNIAGAS